MECILEKLTRDLTHKCVEYATSNQLSIDEDWLQSKIKQRIMEKKISFVDPDTCKLTKEQRCTARLWDGGKGTQCTHRRVKDTYCGKHMDMLQRYNVLRFGDIQQQKPPCDLIKQNNELLSWVDPDPLNRLQKVLDQQSRQIIVATPHLILD